MTHAEDSRRGVGGVGSVLFLVVVLALGLPAVTFGGSFFMLMESDADEPGGEEVYEISFASLADLYSNTQVGAGFTDLPIGTNWSIAGFAFGDGQYHLMVETDDDASGGAEVYLVSFASLADVYSNTASGGGYSAMNISASFSVKGFTYDGNHYHLLLESNDDAPAGDEVYLVSYASLDDVFSNTQFGAGFTDLPIGTNWSIVGFAYDEGRYHLMVETDDDASGGPEVYLVSFASLADVVSNTAVAGDYTEMNVNSLFTIGGLAGGTLFEDGFDFGTTLGWSQTIP